MEWAWDEFFGRLCQDIAVRAVASKRQTETLASVIFVDFVV